jgi:hypothetical protein
VTSEEAGNGDFSSTNVRQHGVARTTVTVADTDTDTVAVTATGRM